MCWYCCTSVRGAVYFGTSVHIFVGLVLFVRWTVLTYDGIVTEKLIGDANVLISTALFGVYTLLFITTSCLIFGGVERESLTMLKWTATGFTMLQILVLTITTTLYLVAPGGWDILGSATTPEMRFLYIAIFILCLIATMNYLIVLFLYIRKLQKSSDTLVGDDHAKRRRNNKNSNTLRISNPLPSPLSASSSYRDHPSSNYAPLSTGTQRQSLMTPESPGIYESLDTSQQHQQLQLQLQHHHQNQIYFPSNNSSVYGSKIQNYSDGIYGPGGGGSITSRGGTRHYPYPHQRYQQPLMVREERHQQDWPVQQNASSAPVLRYNAELNRVHVYGPVRHDHHSNAAAAEPLLQQQQQQQSWPHYHHHHHHQHSQQSN